MSVSFKKIPGEIKIDITLLLDGVVEIFYGFIDVRFSSVC